MAQLLKTRRPRAKPTGGLPPVLARGAERLTATRASAKQAKPAKAKAATKSRKRAPLRAAKANAKAKVKARPARKAARTKTVRATRKGGRRR